MNSTNIPPIMIIRVNGIYETQNLLYYLLVHHVSSERYFKVARHIISDVLQSPNQTFCIRMCLFQAIPAAYVFNRSVTWMAGSNPSEGKDVSLLCMLCVV